MIDSGFYYRGDESAGKLMYEILDNGFEVYIGENAKYPSYRQTEPFIPNPDISYEENAKKYCEDLSLIPKVVDPDESDQRYAKITDIESLRSDIDYLMLLNDSTDE